MIDIDRGEDELLLSLLSFEIKSRERERERTIAKKSSIELLEIGELIGSIFQSMAMLMLSEYLFSAGRWDASASMQNKKVISSREIGMWIRFRGALPKPQVRPSYRTKR